ncbi:hypothetical protein DVH26_29085 [Paenibacillus sp. H1-7]|nr:hypothetical protein DVH26_29085 [Paenibacillus sp. H1-7]
MLKNRGFGSAIGHTFRYWASFPCKITYFSRIADLLSDHPSVWCIYQAIAEPVSDQMQVQAFIFVRHNIGGFVNTLLLRIVPLPK